MRYDAAASAETQAKHAAPSHVADTACDREINDYLPYLQTLVTVPWVFCPRSDAGVVWARSSPSHGITPQKSLT